MQLIALLLCLTVNPTLAGEESTETAEEIPSGIQYPEAHRGPVVDTYFGTQVHDPYRWLEEPDSTQTRKWVDGQVGLTSEWLSDIPRRTAIQERLTQLWNYEKFYQPVKKGKRYFFRHNNGLQNHAVLYRVDKLSDPPIEVLNPNNLSEDGTVSIAMTSISEDGSLVAYGTSDGGSDWRTIYIRDVLSDRDLTESLQWVKFSGATWTHDNNGFFYSRYPAPKNKLESVNENQQLYYHQIGTPQSKDRLIYERPDNPKMGFGTDINEAGDTLFIYVSEGTDERNRLYTKDLNDPEAEVVKLFDAFDAAYYFLGDGLLPDERGWFERWFGPDYEPTKRFWFFTNKDAPNGKVISIDPNHPEEALWTEVIAESEHVLENVNIVGGHLVAKYLEDAKTVVKVHSLSGRLLRTVNLPAIGSAWGFGGRMDDPETFFTFSGFTTPTSVYQYNVQSGESALWKQPSVEFDPRQFETRQVFFKSKDGTEVPMFIIHKRGLTLNGDNPTLLYGYGGFNISLTPSFSLSRLVWMEMGGVYVIANLRGGGEYGQDWHKAGTKLNKQNVFDDFIGAAEWLIDNDYTRPERLGIMGGSNGGLLVGASMTQRPDLFGAAIPSVGVLDMLRYHKFTIGWAWADDYGTSEESEEMFKALHAYSPVHNLKQGTKYPSTMVTTADHDDRVVPAHSYKFAAELQRVHGGENPVLIRIETRAGHGAGTPIKMRIEQVADQWAFLVRSLGMESAEELGEVDDTGAPEEEPDEVEEAAK